MKNFFVYILSFLFFMVLFSCKKDIIYLNENFENNLNGWDILQTTYIHNSIKNNTYVLSSKLDNIMNLSLIQIQDIDKNVIVKTSIKDQEFYGKEGLSGILLWANDKKYPTEYVFFGLNGQGEIVISRESVDPYKALILYKQNSKIYKKHQANIFTVKKMNGRIYFLLNNTSIFAIKELEALGPFYGFATIQSKIEINKVFVKAIN